MHDIDFQLFRSNIHGLDTELQRRLFLSFRELVYRDLLILLNDHALTEDVIQESFMKAIRSGPKTRDGSNMKAWLRLLCRNTAYDLLRKNKKYRQICGVGLVNHDEEDNLADPQSERVDQLVERHIRNETLHEALRELKYEYRVVLYLHYIMELSYAEIVKELGVSEQVLTQRLARARKKLAGYFSEKWGDAR
ncbi:RNA polymerase sigma factor [Paenibacillus sp. MBLB4367]|uniref:RNA polymerase sigma factor n=1 Tax=Paenibacillus sp. MBLB4367 TaxID=3384767 RepID=UPI003907FC15